MTLRILGILSANFAKAWPHRRMMVHDDSSESILETPGDECLQSFHLEARVYVICCCVCLVFAVILSININVLDGVNVTIYLFIITSRQVATLTDEPR